MCIASSNTSGMENNLEPQQSTCLEKQSLAPRAVLSNDQVCAPSLKGVSVPSLSTTSRWKQTAQFPWRLHQMLEDAEANDFANIVSWLPDQRTFRVHEVDSFAQDVLHLYFQQTQYKSFQRQLNLWGFQRATDNGPSFGGYMHEHFVRGNTPLCMKMKRVKVKGTGKRRQMVRSSPSSTRGLPSEEQRSFPRTVSPASLDRAHHEHSPEQFSTSSTITRNPVMPATFKARPIDDLFDDETLTSVLLPVVQDTNSCRHDRSTTPGGMTVRQEDNDPDPFSDMTFFTVEMDQSNIPSHPSSDRLTIVPNHSQFVSEKPATRWTPFGHQEVDVSSMAMVTMMMANHNSTRDDGFSLQALDMFEVQMRL